MSRFISIIILLLCAHFVNAQHSIHGKWRVISIKGEELYMNVKNDSIYYSNMEDSTTINKIIPALSVHFGNLVYIFGSTGVFEARNKYKVDETGTYSVDEKIKMITNVVKRNGLTVTERMKFDFVDHLLQLTYFEDDPVLVITLERVK